MTVGGASVLCSPCRRVLELESVRSTSIPAVGTARINSSRTALPTVPARVYRRPPSSACSTRRSTPCRRPRSRPPATRPSARSSRRPSSAPARLRTPARRARLAPPRLCGAQFDHAVRVLRHVALHEENALHPEQFRGVGAAQFAEPRFERVEIDVRIDFDTDRRHAVVVFVMVVTVVACVCFVSAAVVLMLVRKRRALESDPARR